MRTNIDIDDKLMRRAMKLSGATTKRAAIEAAMRLTVRMKRQEEILKWFGKIEWEGDLAAMRKSRFLNEEGYFDRDAAGEQVEAPQLKAPAKQVAAR
jgi:Arc/MetJ family transcription regulator